MICADFESILVPEDNKKQNPDNSCTNKYQKHVTCNEDTILLIVWLNKVNIVMMWWKNILTKNLWGLKKMVKFWELY